MVSNESRKKHFGIQSVAELDFVFGESVGWAVGLERRSPTELKRRVAAAAISYQVGLNSIDYALKRYVNSDLFEAPDDSLGDQVSDFLAASLRRIGEELPSHHKHGSERFGRFGADITIFRIPDLVNTARILSNRGLWLEVLPILRLCLEMMAWACRANEEALDHVVVSLKAQDCIRDLKKIYPTCGRLYNYMSQFTHWGHSVHGFFLVTKGDRVGVVSASVKYRALGLALCILILDVLCATIKQIYSERSYNLISEILRVEASGEEKKTKFFLKEIRRASEFSEMDSIIQFCG